MKSFILNIVLIFSISKCCEANYIEYHLTFNRIDEDILSKQYQLALNRLDTVYANYEFIYAKHCVKALQICVSAGDSIKANKWLAKCFKQGIPFWYIRQNGLTKLCLAYSTTQKTQEQYDSLHHLYEASIDTNLTKLIDHLLNVDQKYTRRINDGFIPLRYSIYYLQWGFYNKYQLRILKQIIKEKGYPDERLIGLARDLDSALFAKRLSLFGPSEIRNARVQVMLQHCFSSWHKVDPDFKNILYQNLCKGYMPSFQFAIVNDFMCEGRKKYYLDRYEFNRKKTDTNYKLRVNQNRTSIGLNTCEEDDRNTLIEIERRKNKRADAEIMLE